MLFSFYYFLIDAKKLNFNVVASAGLLQWHRGCKQHSLDWQAAGWMAPLRRYHHQPLCHLFISCVNVRTGLPNAET